MRGKIGALPPSQPSAEPALSRRKGASARESCRLGGLRPYTGGVTMRQKIIRLSRRELVAAASIAFLAIAAGIAYAAIPGSGGVINACYQKLNGQLRVIDLQAGAELACCQEVSLKFNQTGPSRASRGSRASPACRASQASQASQASRAPTGFERNECRLHGSRNQSAFSVSTGGQLRCAGTGNPSQSRRRPAERGLHAAGSNRAGSK